MLDRNFHSPALPGRSLGATKYIYGYITVALIRILQQSRRCLAVQWLAIQCRRQARKQGRPFWWPCNLPTDKPLTRSTSHFVSQYRPSQSFLFRYILCKYLKHQPRRAISIDIVKINTCLIMMRECFVSDWPKDAMVTIHPSGLDWILLHSTDLTLFWSIF